MKDKILKYLFLVGGIALFGGFIYYHLKGRKQLAANPSMEGLFMRGMASESGITELKITDKDIEDVYRIALD